ncbi:hypothetical protein ACPV5S_20610, partial [Vibrio astriarenae]
SYLAIVGKLKTSCSSVEAAHIALEAAALLQQFVDEQADPSSPPADNDGDQEDESATASSGSGQKSDDDPQGDESDATPAKSHDTDAADGG